MPDDVLFPGRMAALTPKRETAAEEHHNTGKHQHDGNAPQADAQPAQIHMRRHEDLTRTSSATADESELCYEFQC